MATRKPKNGNKTLKRKITAKDVAHFQKTADNHWVWKRAEIIRLAAEGYNNREIQEITGVNEKNVRHWINRFNAEGFDGLIRRKPNTQRGKLTKEQIEELKELLKKSPKESGYDVLGWTVKLVWRLVEDVFGVKYHRRYLYRLIRRIGFKLAKPYVTNTRQDKEEVKKFYKQVLPAAYKKTTI
jgi:transposase